MVASKDLKWLVGHDPCRLSDRSPAGAVTVGMAVELHLRVDPDMRATVLEADLLVGEPTERGAALAWREFAMGECACGFTAQLPISTVPEAMFYAFRLKMADGALFYYVPRADGRATAGELVVPGVDGEWTEEGWAFAENRLPTHAAGTFAVDGPAPAFQLTIYDPAFATPDWLAGCVMYQIFPDRFSRGTGGVREEGLEYHAAMNRPVDLHADWNEFPAWEDDNGAEVVAAPSETDEDASYDPIDFFGGTLDGICEKLPYLAGLGVEALYLNPICEARSNHRYDTADYEQVDPLLGSNEDFKRLCAEAGKLGIRIVFDAVLSHTGDDSRYFNAKGTYGEPGALQGTRSPFYDWYDFENPTEGRTYRCWWGFPALPEVDETNPSWQRYIFGERRDAEEPSGVLPLWLDCGTQGFRLDVADELPDEVLERLRTAVKSIRPDAAIIGEVWEDATTKVSYGSRRTYALGRALDSVMNYPLRSALLGFATGTVDAQQLSAFLMLQQANYPEPLYRCTMNLLSSHDVERVRSVLALGKSFKHLDRAEQFAAVAGITQQQDEEGAELQAMTVALLYALPGSPCLYYGDERGLQGGGDPFCRATFPWEADARTDCGADLTSVYRELGMMRKSSPVLREGSLACFASDPDVLCLVRESGGAFGASEHSSWVVVANRSDATRTGAVDVASLGIAAQQCIPHRVFGSEDAQLSSEAGIVHYTIPARSTAYFAIGATKGTVPFVANGTVPFVSPLL